MTRIITTMIITMIIMMIMIMITIIVINYPHRQSWTPGRLVIALGPDLYKSPAKPSENNFLKFFIACFLIITHPFDARGPISLSKHHKWALSFERCTKPETQERNDMPGWEKAPKSGTHLYGGPSPTGGRSFLNRVVYSITRQHSLWPQSLHIDVV